MVKLIDTHSHLNDEYFINSREAIIASLDCDNISKVFVVGYDLESSIEAINLSLKHKNVYAIIGMHPEHANAYNAEFEAFIEKNINNNKVLAIGEIGLDYYWNKDNKQIQKQVLVSQLKLAHKHKVPFIIHCRDAIGDLITILNQNKNILEFGGVVHCFNESIESYKQLSALGLKFSFGGSITFKNSKNAPELLKVVDVNDILLETDCPYLTPEPLRGKEKNQPKNVWLVLNKIAEYKNMNLGTLAEITNKNVYKVFKKLTNEWFIKKIRF